MSLIAVITILVAYILDCVDEEIARAAHKSSKIGSQLEHMGHWVTNQVLILGIAVGVYRNASQPLVFVAGFVAIIGDCTFHFLYNQLNLIFNRTLDNGFLHILTKWLYQIMPIDTNLIIITAVANQLWLFLVLWGILSNTVWIVVFALYYRVEVRYLRHQTELDQSRKEGKAYE